MGASVSAIAERSTPPTNNQAPLNDQICEVIDLEDGRQETPDPRLDVREQVLGRGGKRRAVAHRHVPTKRPRRAMTADKVRLLESRFSN
jgi:hypothetical protein